MSADLIADIACPECAQGKHPNCDGGSWDMTSDQPGTCPCWATGHANDSMPAEALDRLDQTLRDAADVMRRTPPAEAREVIAALRRMPEDENADRLADQYEAELDRLGGDR